MAHFPRSPCVGARPTCRGCVIRARLPPVVLG